MASIPAATGPRAKTSAMISRSPRTSPYSPIVALGNSFSAEQNPPNSANVLHVRQVLIPEHW